MTSIYLRFNFHFYAHPLLDILLLLLLLTRSYFKSFYIFEGNALTFA